MYVDNLFPLQQFQRTGKISYMWTRTKHKCTVSCYTSSPVYKEKVRKYMQLMDLTCFALWLKLTWQDVPCSHKEADMHRLLHIAVAVKKG